MIQRAYEFNNPIRYYSAKSQGMYKVCVSVKINDPYFLGMWRKSEFIEAFVIVNIKIGVYQGACIRFVKYYLEKAFPQK